MEMLNRAHLFNFGEGAPIREKYLDEIETTVVGVEFERKEDALAFIKWMENK